MRYHLRKLIHVGRLMFQEGLVDARAGNLSVKVCNGMLISRRGSHLGNLGEEDFVFVSFEGGVLWERASSELLVHRAVYLHTEKSAVVHAHPIHTVALSLKVDVIRPVDSEGMDLLGEVRVIGPYKPGSEELAQAVAEALKDSHIVVVRGHGVFSADRDPFYAYSHISVLEHSCKILML